MVNKDKLRCFTRSEVVAAEIVPATDNIGGLVQQMLKDMLTVQTRFSRFPVITEQAGYFERVFHDWKMQRQRSIAENEREVIFNNMAASKAILEVITDAGLFLKRVESEANALDCDVSLKRLEVELKLQEVNKMKAETRKTEAEARIAEADAQYREAEARKLENPERRAERTIAVD
ncbi:MAG: hypothetical protein AB9866_18805 [Syntrophobacteraceae bacterium]